MSVRNAYCCVNGGNCQANVANPCLRPSWYHKFIKPLAFCIITSLLGTYISSLVALSKFFTEVTITILRFDVTLAMSVSHICDKYSASSSFKVVKADLGNLRRHLNTLSVND